MADGHTHARHARRVFYFVGILWLVIGLAGPGVFLAALGLPLGAFLGMLISPDQDIHSGVTYNERRIVRRWGPLGWLWVWWWNGYGYRMAHRSWLSHALVIGTAGRMLYFFCPPLFCFLIDWSLRGRRIACFEQIHTILIGVVWVLIVFSGVYFLGTFFDLERILPWLAYWLGGIYLGWFLQDFIHLAADGWKVNS